MIYGGGLYIYVCVCEFNWYLLVSIGMNEYIIYREEEGKKKV